MNTKSGRCIVETALPSDPTVPLFASFKSRAQGEHFAQKAAALGRVVRGVAAATEGVIDDVADWFAISGGAEDDVEADWIEADRLTIVSM